MEAEKLVNGAFPSTVWVPGGTSRGPTLGTLARAAWAMPSLWPEGVERVEHVVTEVPRGQAFDMVFDE